MTTTKNNRLRKIFDIAQSKVLKNGIKPRDADELHEAWLMFMTGAAGVITVLDEASPGGVGAFLDALKSVANEVEAVAREVQLTERRKN